VGLEVYELDDDDLAIAHRQAELVTARATERGYTRGVHERVRLPDADRRFEAYASEIAVARFLRRRWEDDPDAFRVRPDVEPDIEVRRTWDEAGHDDLPVYTDDHLERRFVLAVGWAPRFILAGWIPGVVALETAHRFFPPKGGEHGVYYVRQTALWRPVADLATTPAGWWPPEREAAFEAAGWG
jgi:hypothetical protein